MQPDRFRVEKTDLCLPHSILPAHCTQCRMETFNQRVSELGLPVNANVVDNVITSYVDGPNKLYSLDFRYADNHELDSGGYHGDLADGVICQALFPTSHPYAEPLDDEEKGRRRAVSDNFFAEMSVLQPNNPIFNLSPEKLVLYYPDKYGKPNQFDLKTLRIVFVGPRESFIGFMCCLLYKYGQTTMVPLGLEFGSSDSVPESFVEEIRGRWHWGGDLDGCIYAKHPEAEAVISYPDGAEYGQHFSAENIREFWAGYRKMLDLNISEVQDGSVIDPFEIRLRKLGHRELCKECHPYEDETEGDYYGDVVQEDKILAMGPVECHAYWYYL